MSFGTSYCDTLQRDNEYLRDEIGRRAREESERQDRESQDEMRRRLERKAEREESLHYASGWGDAFSNALVLLGREAREEIKEEAEHPDSQWPVGTFFRDEYKATEAAQKLYREEMTKAQEEINRIEAAVRERVASQIKEEFPNSSLPDSLRSNNYDSLVNW